MRNKICLVCFFLCLCLGLIPAAHGAKPAQSGQDLEVILDASGSMRAKIGQQTKMEIAKKALLDLVAGLKGRDDLSLAIRVYGHQSHRSKKDCQDSKLEIPLGPVNYGQVKDLMKRIKPQGYTPLAYSLGQAAGDFKKSESSRSIILITDGLETCKGDPCAIAKKLASKGLKVTLHVVGFDLKKKEMQALSCLTKPSGGLLLEAGDAGELTKALEKAVKQVVKKNLIVETVSAKNKPRDAHVSIFKAGDQKSLAIHHGPTTYFSLEPGAYDIVARDFSTSQVVKLKNIKVEEDKVTKKKISFASGKLTITVKDSKGKAFNKGWAEVFSVEDGQEKSIKGDYLIGKPKTYNLPVGTYLAKVQMNKMSPVQVINDIVIEAEKEIKKEVVFGQVNFSVLVKDPAGKQLEAYVEVWSVINGSPSAYKSASISGKPFSLVLAPGQYQITAKRKDTGKKLTTEVFELPDQPSVTKDIVIP